MDARGTSPPGQWEVRGLGRVKGRSSKGPIKAARSDREDSRNSSSQRRNAAERTLSSSKGNKS